MTRIERQGLLYDEAKTFRFVIPEAVLRWPYGPTAPDEHREQLARLEWATRRPNIELGALPMSPIAVWRSTGFVIYDEIEDGDPLVHIEWLTRPYNESELGAVEMCRRAFTNLLGASVTGDDARRLIGAAAHDLQTTMTDMRAGRGSRQRGVRPPFAPAFQIGDHVRPGQPIFVIIRK